MKCGRRRVLDTFQPAAPAEPSAPGMAFLHLDTPWDWDKGATFHHFTLCRLQEDTTKALYTVPSLAKLH